MKYKFFLSPDAAATGGTSTPDDNHNTNSFIPTKEADILSVSKIVNTSWKAATWATLQGKKQSDFEIEITNLGTAIGKTSKAAGNKGSDASALKNLDAQIAIAIGENGLRIDIKKKFKANAIAQYGRYGIVKIGKNYNLPTDRDQRLKAMELIPQALLDDGLGGAEYGTAFWTKMITDYGTALGKQADSNQTRGGGVGEKDVLIASIVTTLRRIILLLRANFYDDPEPVIRKWGFRKTGQ